MNATDAAGPKLADYIESHLRALGLTINAWSDRVPGVNGSDLTRWKNGTAPRLEKFRAVAEGLNVPIVDVLLAAGVLEPSDVAGRHATTPAAPSIDVAIDTDPTLTDLQRRSMRDILGALRVAEAQAAAGEPPAVRGRVTKEATPARRTRA